MRSRGCNPARWSPLGRATSPRVQYSAYALLRRYATGVLKEGWSSASVLGVGEALKFGISLAMMAAKEDGSESPKASPHPHNDLSLRPPPRTPPPPLR